MVSKKHCEGWTQWSVPSWAKDSIIYFGIFHDQSLGSNLWFRKPEKLLWGVNIYVCPTLDSGFWYYRLMVNSQGFISRKNCVPRVTSKVTKSPMGWLIVAPLVFPSLVVCCICIFCRLFCVWYRILSLAYIPRHPA